MYRRTMRLLFYTGIFICQFLGYTGFGQAVTNIVNQSGAYNSRPLQEKLFLHTDKEFYVAGEILWFRIYCVDGNSHQPLQLSKVAYVEVADYKNEPVLQAKISLNPGEEKGSFYIPTSLRTGYYTVRAYTNWMKNSDADGFFEKRIAVVNTLKSPEQPVSQDPAPVSVNFFPEGGSLVRDVESRIGFIITGARGGITDCKGYIIDKNNDTVSAFVPLKFGIGNFNFKPLTGNSYKAIIALPGGSVITKTLPDINEQGYAMKVTENGQGQMIVTVQKRVPGNQGMERIVLAVHARQVLQAAEQISINNNGSTEFVIDKKKIGQGVIHFTIFNGSNQPVCERLVFVKPVSAAGITAASDQAVYGTRKKVQLSLQSSAGNTAPLELSAAVFHLDDLQKADGSTIVDYMWLLSDLAGHVESPGYYFSNDPDVAAATDNLMLTHGWRKFRWNGIQDNKNTFIKYLPEINGHVVTGTVINTRTGQPAPNTSAYLSIPGNPFGFYTARSDANGQVYFEVKNYYGNRPLIAQPGISTDSLYRVDILQPFVKDISGPALPPYVLTERVREQLLRKSIGMQVQNIYTGDSLRNFDEPALTDSLPFYGWPEVAYKLDDYKRFTTMEEVLREYVAEIGVSVRSGRLVFKIFNPEAHDFYNGNSLVMVDGVPLTDANKIFSYDPLKVRKLDVIRSRYVVGQSIFNGIASFTTYDGNFEGGYALDPKFVAIDYNGLQLHREFYSPAYETREQLESRIPDFRNTLFWAPAVTTDQQGRATLTFYSSDQPGRYAVIVQGMNQQGDFVATQTTFEVK